MKNEQTETLPSPETLTPDETKSAAPLVAVKGKGKKQKPVPDILTAEIVDPSKPPREEKELDEAVHKVEELKSEAAVSYHRLGTEVARIYDEKLWKLRRRSDDKGKTIPRWAGFDAFCVAELGMGQKNALRLMDVARTYTEPQVQKFGTVKLGLILEAPAEARAELEQKLAGGASVRELKKEVKAVREKTGHVSADKNPKVAKAHAAAQEKAKAAPAKVTVGLVLGAQTIPLYKKPPTTKNLDFSKLERAKKINQMPFGKLELPNGVSMYFTVNEAATGELAIKLLTKRDEE